MVDFLEPAYGARTLSDVLPAIARGFGLPEVFAEAPTRLEVPPASGYVVILVDGLGHRLLAEHRHHAPFLASLLGDPGTAGVPSTTATSLTSLGTALPPGQHGLVGFTSRIPGTQELLNALWWDKKSVDPLDWQPHQTGFARLQSAGVHVQVINKREFAGSGLTLCSCRGVDYVGADKAGERIVAAVAATAVRPSLAYLYESDLDWTGHRYGVDSPQWRAELSAVDASVEHLREVLDPAVRLIVLADHGMVDSPREHRIDVDEDPVLRDGVVLLGGEARFRHLYCAAGAVDDVAVTWRAVLGDRAAVLTREEAIDRGWFGAVSPSVRPRLGDVVVAAADQTTLISSRDFPYEDTLVGFHGSLTPAEMEIPILVC